MKSNRHHPTYHTELCHPIYYDAHEGCGEKKSHGMAVSGLCGAHYFGRECKQLVSVQRCLQVAPHDFKLSFFFFAPVCCTGDNIQDVHLIDSFTISFLLLLDAACCSKTMVPGTLTGCGAKRQVFWNYRKQYSRALLVNFPASHKKGTIWET